MKTFLIAVVLAVTLSAAHGLKCYMCESHDSDLKAGDCGDEFKTEEKTDMLVTCNDTQTYCRKQKSGANHIWTVVERGCADQCEERNLAYVDVVKCCKGDGCNGGSLLEPTVALLLCVASFLTLKKFL
nr:toxin-TOLIP domain-containing protein [Arenicola marina]